MERAYLDCNATRPLSAEARAAWLEWAGRPANPSSTHAEGRAAGTVLVRARATLLSAVGAPDGEVVWTAGATEAANLVLTPDLRLGRSPLPHDRLLVGAVEHAAVLAGGRFPRERIETLPVDRDGRVRAGALRNALAEGGRCLVAIQVANNETGVLQDIAALSAIVREHGGTLVCDAVQALDRVPLDMAALGADFLIVSSHKVGGPHGAGALVARGPMLMPAPLMSGGGQQGGHRAGTENVAAIAGFAAAVEAAHGLRAADSMRALRDRFEREAEALAPSIALHGTGAPRLPNTSAFSFATIPAETAAIAFDLDGIAVSAGSACASGTARSHVLAAMGAGDGAVRVSLGPDTTEADIDRALGTVARLGARDADKAARRPLAA